MRWFAAICLGVTLACGGLQAGEEDDDLREKLEAEIESAREKCVLTDWKEEAPFVILQKNLQALHEFHSSRNSQPQVTEAAIDAGIKFFKDGRPAMLALALAPLTNVQLFVAPVREALFHARMLPIVALKARRRELLEAEIAWVGTLQRAFPAPGIATPPEGSELSDLVWAQAADYLTHVAVKSNNIWRGLALHLIQNYRLEGSLSLKDVLISWSAKLPDGQTGQAWQEWMESLFLHESALYFLGAEEKVPALRLYLTEIAEPANLGKFANLTKADVEKALERFEKRWAAIAQNVSAIAEGFRLDPKGNPLDRFRVWLQLERIGFRAEQGVRYIDWKGQVKDFATLGLDATRLDFALGAVTAARDRRQSMLAYLLARHVLNARNGKWTSESAFEGVMVAVAAKQDFERRWELAFEVPAIERKAALEFWRESAARFPKSPSESAQSDFDALVREARFFYALVPLECESAESREVLILSCLRWIAEMRFSAQLLGIGEPSNDVDILYLAVLDDANALLARFKQREDLAAWIELAILQVASIEPEPGELGVVVQNLFKSFPVEKTRDRTNAFLSALILHPTALYRARPVIRREEMIQLLEVLGDRELHLTTTDVQSLQRLFTDTYSVNVCVSQM